VVLKKGKGIYPCPGLQRRRNKRHKKRTSPNRRDIRVSLESNRREAGGKSFRAKKENSYEGAVLHDEGGFLLGKKEKLETDLAANRRTEDPETESIRAPFAGCGGGGIG